MRKLALLVALVPAIAFAKSATSSLESKAIAALADIAKARTALDQGNDKTGDSWLTKAKGLLTTLLQHNGATQQTAQEQTPKEPENQSALSRAESAAQKLDPSLAGKLGTKPAEQNQTGSSGALGAVSDLKSIYDKVSLAQSLLHKGNSMQAKSILDEIPTSPADALKLLHR
ncbi:MAG: hypothetical protein ACJ79D_19645 [Myxococcales bacterium]